MRAGQQRINDTVCMCINAACQLTYGVVMLELIIIWSGGGAGANRGMARPRAFSPTRARLPTRAQLAIWSAIKSALVRMCY